MKRRLLTAALLVCAASLQAQTTHRDSVLAEARFLKSIYRTDDAIEKLSALVQPGAMDEGVLAELADCHFQSGAYEDAVGTYFLLSSKAPDNLLYKIRLMQAYSRQRAYPLSIRAGRAILQQDSIPAVLSFVGDSFRQLEQVDSALWYYRRSLAQKPMNETVLSKAVGILIDKEKYDEAIAQSEPFLAEDPDNMTIAPLQGLAYYRKGDYESAGKIFQRQEDIGNGTYPIHYYLGQSYWHTKIIYRAEKELLTAWQIDSSDVNLAYSIAAVKRDAVRSFEREIMPWLDKALKMLEPDPAVMSRIHQQYALGYYGREDSWDQAIAHYKEAYRYNPKLISALSTIAYCYQQKKEYKTAIEWYEKYLKVARPDSQGYRFAADNLKYLRSERFMEEP